MGKCWFNAGWMLVFHGIFWDLVNCHWIARGNHDVPRLAGYKKSSAKLPGAVQMSFRSIAHGNFLSVSDTQKATPAPEVAPGKGILIVVGRTTSAGYWCDIELHLQGIHVRLLYVVTGTSILFFHSVGNGMSSSQLTKSNLFQRGRYTTPPTSYSSKLTIIYPN